MEVGLKRDGHKKGVNPYLFSPQKVRPRTSAQTKQADRTHPVRVYPHVLSLLGLKIWSFLLQKKQVANTYIQSILLCLFVFYISFQFISGDKITSFLPYLRKNVRL